MNHRELAVLCAVNTASSRYRRKGHDYEATCAQITDVFNNEDDVQEGWPLTTLEVGATLRSMVNRREPLVEKIDSRRWHLTDAGVRVLNA